MNYAIMRLIASAAIAASLGTTSQDWAQPHRVMNVHEVSSQRFAPVLQSTAAWKAALHAALPPRSRIVYGFTLTESSCGPMVATYMVSKYSAIVGLTCYHGAYRIVWRHRLGQQRPFEFASSASGVPHFLATWEAKSGAVTIVSGQWDGAFMNALACGSHLCAALQSRHGIEIFGGDHFIVATANAAHGVTYTWDGTAYRAASNQPTYAPNHRVMATIDSGQKMVGIDLVGVAATEDQQELGLMAVRYLAPSAGMLFQFAKDTTTAFWMKNTLIPLSIAFISADGDILDIQDMQALDDRTLHYACGAQHPCPYRYAIEVNRDFFTTHGIMAGARVTLSG